MASELSSKGIQIKFKKEPSSVIKENTNITINFCRFDKITNQSVTVAFVGGNLDLKTNFWSIYSYQGISKETYRSIFEFAISEDDQKIIKLENCLDKK